MRDFLYAVRAEPAGAVLVTGNLIGLVLVAWLLAIC